MNKKRFILLLALIVILLFLHSSYGFAQTTDDWDNPDPGGDIPIPGILYFLLALLGVGIKKLYNGRKKDH